MRIYKIKSTSEMDFFSIETISELELPLMQFPVEAGFPSPAEDYIDLSIDLNKELIKNPSATFLVRVKGLSMVDAAISPEDILIVDRSLEPQNGKIAVCYLNGEFTLKRIFIAIDSSVWLMPENKNYKPIKIEEYDDFTVWGMVSYVIKKAY